MTSAIRRSIPGEHQRGRGLPARGQRGGCKLADVVAVAVTGLAETAVWPARFVGCRDEAEVGETLHAEILRMQRRCADHFLDGKTRTTHRRHRKH